MKKVGRVVALNLLFSIYGFGQSAELENIILIWDANRELVWTDFQGETDPNTISSAMTSHKIEILPTNVLVDDQDNIHGYEKMTAEAHFYINKSWTTTQSLTILKHERLHFDITELYARKIRQRFAEYKANKIASFSVYSDCYQLFWNECRKTQQRYDQETDHGRDIAKNELWAHQIETQLEALSAFE